MKKKKKPAEKELNRNEELLLYVQEEALHNLRDLYKKVKYIKIKDARIRNNRMFQEDQGMKQPKH